MAYSQEVYDFEIQRLAYTLDLIQKQLVQAKENSEENKSAIIQAKKELRENTDHTVSNLWSSEGFEALAALSQYVNPVTDKIESYQAIQNRIRVLEGLLHTPYFARIDFKFEDENEFEKIYIGRSSLMDDDAYEMTIYDWRSPIASVFYRFVLGPAYYDAPEGKISGEINLKRQYEISNGKLAYFFDADIQIVDAFLRKMLSQNTSSKMKTIVETIQKDQDVVIRDMENDLMMVQGVAGSGKTSIALHRAAYLMYQGLTNKLTANNIIIISPNTLFEEYIGNVLPELGEDNVTSLVFDEILQTILKNRQIQSKHQFLENIITSGTHSEIIKRCKEFKSSREFTAILNRFIQDIPKSWINFQDVYWDGKCVITKEAQRERICSGRLETPLAIRLEQLMAFVEALLIDGDGKPLKKSDAAPIISDLERLISFDAATLYKSLFKDDAYFYSLAQEIPLPADIEEILDFTRDGLWASILPYDDASAMAYLKLKLTGKKIYQNIKQVVIDEAQDYYPLDYELFTYLFPTAKFTVLGDINQTLEKQEDLFFYQSISTILNKKKSTLVTMDKSFRCTNEILTFSERFIEHNLDIKSFNRSGDQPMVFTAETLDELGDMIANEINTCLEQGWGTIGLICKSEKNGAALYELLKNKANVKLIGVNETSNLQGAFIIPVYLSKGLEFDSVLICDADEKNYYSKDDKKLLYIGCTRALHRLTLFCCGKASTLL